MESLRSPVELYLRAGDSHSVWEDVRELGRFSHLLGNLVYRDIAVRYRRSVLGFLWSFLNPLLMMLIFSIVFSTFFRFEIEFFEVYFLSYYLVWIFFSQVTVSAATSFIAQGSMFRRVPIPKSIFAVATVASGLVNLLLSCVPLLLIMLVVGAPVRPALLFLPAAFLLIALFSLGVALGVSAISVYFNDVVQMYQVGVVALMYLTPIFYPLSIVPERYQVLIRCNPLYHLFDLVRGPVYHGVVPDIGAVGRGLLLALGSLAVGWAIFRRLSRNFLSRI